MSPLILIHFFNNSCDFLIKPSFNWTRKKNLQHIYGELHSFSCCCYYFYYNIILVPFSKKGYLKLQVIWSYLCKQYSGSISWFALAFWNFSQCRWLGPINCGQDHTSTTSRFPHQIPKPTVVTGDKLRNPMPLSMHFTSVTHSLLFLRHSPSSGIHGPIL